MVTHTQTHTHMNAHIHRYLSLADSSPLYCVELGHHVVDLIRIFNTQSCQLVLGAGAVRTAGLRSISAKHLALR